MKETKGVQSVERALAILEAVADAGELGVTELGERLGLHVATVHNLLRTLAARHYLTNAGGRYRLGPALAALSSRWDPVQSLPGELQPYLDRISAETGEAASATVLIGTSARLIAFKAGTQAITIQYPQWDWPNAMSLATGRLLVAHEPEASWPEFISRNAGAEPYWSPERWTKALRHYRAEGCCVLVNHSGGQTALACPVRGTDGVVIAAIGASAPTFRATPQHGRMMLQAVHQAAWDLSRQLGCSIDPEDLPDINWNPDEETT